MEARAAMVGTMLELWAAHAVHGAWQALAVSAIVLTIVRVAPGWPSAAREGLVAIALVKFLVPPFLSVPTGLLALAAAWAPAHALALQTVHGNGYAAWDAPAAPAGILPVLFALQLAGTLVVMAVAILGWRRTRRYCGTCEAAAPELDARVRSLAETLHVHRTPRLKLSPVVPAPAACGVIRPSIRHSPRKRSQST